jgi:hypothetical protein
MRNRAGSVVRASVLIVLVLGSRGTAGAFGPHGDGAIGSMTERAELPRGFPIYQDYEAPFAYPSMTRRDLHPIDRDGEVIEVEGASEMTGFFIPAGLFLGIGPTSGLSIDIKDRSIRAALRDAKARYGVRNLYDIRIDLRIFSILGIYNKTTTIVHAKAIRESPPPPQKNLSP